MWLPTLGSLGHHTRWPLLQAARPWPESPGAWIAPEEAEERENAPQAKNSVHQPGNARSHLQPCVLREKDPPIAGVPWLARVRSQDSRGLRNPSSLSCLESNHSIQPSATHLSRFACGKEKGPRQKLGCLSCGWKFEKDLACLGRERPKLEEQPPQGCLGLAAPPGTLARVSCLAQPVV